MIPIKDKTKDSIICRGSHLIHVWSQILYMQFQYNSEENKVRRRANL